MSRRVLPAPLALSALVADLSGAHGLAFAALLAAIPAGFVLMLECYGDALEGRCGGGRPLGAGVGLLLLVFSAALRSPALVGGVPRLAVTAVSVCLLVYGLLAAVALAPVLRPAPAES
jgi:hypothetical protein